MMSRMLPQLTLYDILCYLFPGTVVTSWVYFIFPIPMFEKMVPDTKSALFWVTFLISGYIVGHLLQAIANYTIDCDPLLAKFKISSKFKIPTELKQTVISIIKKSHHNLIFEFKKEAHSLNDKDILDICKAHVLKCGCFPEREIFTCREDFYRGLAIAFLFMLLYGILLYYLFGKNKILGIKPSWVELLIIAIFMFSAAYLCRQRFKRFKEYKYRGTIFAFINCFLFNKNK